MGAIADRRAELLERIARAAQAAGRKPNQIEMVAVSKTVGAEQVREAWDAGQRAFGENRAQEFRAKTRSLSDLAIDWHFVGSLQTNKVRNVLPGAALIHSVDRAELAAKISRRVGDGARQPVLVQVNVTGESTKAGVEPDKLAALLDEICALSGLSVEGLMTIGPLSPDPETIRKAFDDLRTARDAELSRERPNAPLQQLSMGMTGDFETAIAAGATIVRIGTALFGARPATP